MRSCFFLW